jgi:hypothetical protein
MTKTVVTWLNEQLILSYTVKIYPNLFSITHRADLIVCLPESSQLLVHNHPTWLPTREE